MFSKNYICKSSTSDNSATHPKWYDIYQLVSEIIYLIHFNFVKSCQPQTLFGIKFENKKF